MYVLLNTWHDKGTGRDTVVTHTRARLYAPVVMRFTTLDPLAEMKPQGCYNEGVYNIN